MSILDEKEKKLREDFDKEQKAALLLEEQIKALQAKHQEKILILTRLQGAFSLIKELREEGQT